MTAGLGGKPITGLMLQLALVLLCCTPAWVHGAAFLEERLPLKAVVTTPLELLSNDTLPVSLSGRQAITVVFSRPVIALGADFGRAELPSNLVPFRLGCSVPGLFRWVTTSIARFDPLVDWPTDLACTFTWNQQLVSYDGAPFVLPRAKAVQLVTPQLAMTLSTVTSESANNLTDNQWNAFIVMEDAFPPDHPPEVPYDGNITLSFSYPVVLSQLQHALQVVQCCNSDAGSGKKVTVLPCYKPTYDLPTFQGIGSTDTSTTAANATCAVVRISPPLPQGTGAILRMPAGVRYNPYAGSTTNTTDIYVWGLRAFRIPLRRNFQQLANASDELTDTNNAIQYRRMTMWLPHGLAPGTSLASLGRTMSICQYSNPYDWSSTCISKEFNLTQPNKGALLMTVPDLQPHQHYRLDVQSNSQIRDGYNLPLLNSTAFFFTADPYPGFQGPQLSGYESTVLLEVPSGQPPLDWPFVSQGSDADVTRASAWKLGKGQLPAVLGGVVNSRLQPRAFGQPVDTLVRRNSTTATFGNLHLGPGPSMSLVGTCCIQSTDSNGAPIKVLSAPSLVVQSNLQLAVVTNERQLTAWVTDTQDSSSPLEGAKVTVYSSVYSQPTTAGPSCTTGADGTCVLDLSPLTSPTSSPKLNVVVEAAGQGTLVSPSMDIPYVQEPANYTGDLVLDRKLVKPGDTLHVVGYIQAQGASGLSLPNLTAATLTVTPNFDTSDHLSIPVTVNPKYGSIHAAIPIPATATGSFQLQLQVPSHDTASAAGDLSYSDFSYSSDGTSDSGTSQVPGASEQFTVAEPRPPTALLNMTTPSWVMPNGTVPIYLRAVSYIGANIANATISLTWYTSLAKGALNATTNATGDAFASIPLGELPPANATRAGDTLRIDATWVGPTREVITKSTEVTIAEGPVSIKLTPAPATDLPNVPFGVAATTTSNEDADFGLPVSGVHVTVSIVRNETGSVEGCTDAQLSSLSDQRCSIDSGGNDLAACQLTLPCAGDFLLRGCATAFGNGTKITGPNGSGACAETPIGRNVTAWAASPWVAQPELVLLPDKANYSHGDTAVLALQNPWWGPASGMLIWGDPLHQQRKWVASIPHGPSTVEIGPLGPECRGGCSVTLVTSVARPAKGPLAPLPSVPTSKLFDPLAPHTQSDTVSLGAVQDNVLNVTVAVAAAATSAAGEAVVPPEGTAQISMAVVDALTGAPAGNAEVTVIVVDRAILDLLDYPLQDIATHMLPSVSSSVTVTNLNDQRVQRSAINATFATLQRCLLSVDPWLPLTTTVQPGKSYPSTWQSRASYPSTSPVDEPDASYLRKYTSPVTLTPFYSWGLSQRYPAASAVPEASEVLRLQQTFQTTPLFQVYKTNASGTATATFRAPTNLGTFSVRAYVTSNSGRASNKTTATPSKYGSNETSLVVRRALSLTPSVPRAVRVGDEFEAGVVVSATAANVTPTITATLISNSSASSSNSSAPLVLVGGTAPSQTVTLTTDQPQREVRFRFLATAIGNSTVRFVATTGATAEAADALQLEIPVIAKQSDVYLATSFSLAAGNGSAARRVKGLVLPKAEPGSGSLDLLAGVGHVPAVEAAYEQLAQQQQPSDSLHGDTSLALGILPLILSAYGPNATNTNPALNDSTTLRDVSLTALNNTAAVLTDATYGLLWTDPRAGAYYAPSWTDVRLNAWALWLVGEVPPPNNDPVYAAASEGLVATSPTWRTAIETQLVKDATAARSSPEPFPYSDLDTLTWAHLALGATWVPRDTSKEVQSDLSMQRLTASLVNLTVGGQARVGLALLQQQAMTAQQTHVVDGIIKGMLNSVRVAGKTAYIAEAPGSASSAGLQDQAFALLFLTRAHTSSPLIPPLAEGLAAGQPNPLGALCISTSAWDAPITSLALQSYDSAQGSTNPDATLTVSAGPQPLLAAHFTLANPGYLARSTTPWSAVPAGAALSATAVGRGEVSVAASLHFVPAEVLAFPTYRGLWVERVVQLEEAAADGAGAALAAVPLAKLVTVTVQVTSSDDLSQVIVDVLMPGGLEPLDPLVYPDTELQTLCGYGDASSPVNLWPVCPDQQTHPSEVRFIYRSIGAGTQTIRFKATAATVGRFLLPPVKAYASGQPEVMGLSAAGNLTVCDDETGRSATTASAAGGGAGQGKDGMTAACKGGSKTEAAAPVKGCPGNCSGNGVCNLAAGTCVCNAGFHGDACETLAGSR